MLIQLSLIAVIGAIIGLTALDRRNLAYLYAFFLPFAGVTYEVGLQVNPEKMTTLYMLVFMALFHEQFRFKSYVVLYLVTAVGITFLMSMSLPPYADEFPLLRGRLRWVFQIVYLFMSFAPLHYVPSVLKDTADVARLLRFFVLSCLLQALMGIAQYVVFQYTGADIFPMSLFMGIESKLATANFDFGHLRIMRICALGGEPKNLSYSLATALAVVYAYFILKKQSRSLIPLMLVFAAAIFLTLSSQGIVLLAIVLMLVPVLLMVYRRKVTYRSVGTVLAVALVSWYIWNFTFAGKLLQTRTVERFTEAKEGEGRGGVEDFDVIILAYFQDHPQAVLTGLGLGNVHFHTSEYIPAELSYYIYKNVFVSKKGIIRIVSETGLLGLLVFALMCFIPLYNLSKYQLSGQDQLWRNVLLIATLTVLFNYMVTCDGPTVFLLMLAAVLAFNRSIFLKRQSPCAA